MWVNRARRRRGWGNVGIPRLLRDFQAQWERWKSRGCTFPRFPLRPIFPAKLWILVIFEKPRQMQIFPNSRGEPFLGTPLHALREERHFALVESFCFSNHRLARNRFQVRSLDPTHASLRSTTADHDYYFELLREEEWNAQSIARCSIAHHSDFRAVPRANRTS